MLKERFLEALARYMDDPDEQIEGFQYVQRAMTATAFVDADLEEARQKMKLLSGMIRNCIMMNASATVSEREYRQQYAELTRQYEEQKESAADSQNCGGRRDFVLCVPIVPALRVSPLPNSARICTSPRAGQQMECCQRYDRALGDVIKIHKFLKI